MLSNRSLVLGTAIPVATALEAFTKQEDALLAVFIFGLSMGAESPALAEELSAYGETILRDPTVSAEWEHFLGTTATMTEILVCD